jgi:hypothetical protein
LAIPHIQYGSVWTKERAGGRLIISCYHDLGNESSPTGEKKLLVSKVTQLLPFSQAWKRMDKQEANKMQLVEQHISQVRIVPRKGYITKVSVKSETLWLKPRGLRNG